MAEMNAVSSFLVSAWTGFVGNIFFLSALALVGYVLHFLPRRRKLKRFFLKSKGHRLFVILSHIRVVPGGAMGVFGGTYSFASSTIPVKEAEVAQQFKGAFLSPIPGLSNQPGLLSSLLIRDFPVEVSPSPLNILSIPIDGTIIAVGSSAFNAAALHIENNLNPPARFQSGNAGTVLASGASSTDAAVGFIAKMLDTVNNRYAFYVAGPSEEATAASLLYLLESWPELEKRYRNRDTFAVAIRAIASNPIRGRVEFYGP